jgi:hypothetical protein
MRFFIDHSQPEESIDSRWTELSYDGLPDSHVLEIPMHWHKVRLPNSQLGIISESGVFCGCSYFILFLA